MGNFSEQLHAQLGRLICEEVFSVILKWNRKQKLVYRKQLTVVPDPVVKDIISKK